MPSNHQYQSAQATPDAEVMPLWEVAEDFSEVPLKAGSDEDSAAAAALADEDRPKLESPPWEIKWINILVVTTIHLLALVSLTYKLQMWQTFVWNFFVLGYVSGFGVTGGTHRLWTHRSYKAKLPLRIFLMIGHEISGVNSIFDWVRDHRVHHKFSDTDADPHNARRGFFFSHVGWLFLKKHPEVVRRGRSVDMSDILADPVVQFNTKHHIKMFYLMCVLIPTVVPVYFWDESWMASFCGCMLRWTLALNFAWSVNSFAHLYGGHPFNRHINPANNMFVSFFGMGEGWHNYHHVFPWDYKTSEHGLFNTTMHIIRLFERVGWAYDLKSAPESLIQRVASRYGDGSHPRWTTFAPEVPAAAAEDPSLVDGLTSPHPSTSDWKKLA